MKYIVSKFESKKYLISPHHRCFQKLCMVMGVSSIVDKTVALQKISENNSQLCIGLDLRVPDEEKLSTALEIIDTTHDLAVAYKPNRQYWLGHMLEDMKQLTQRIQKYNCISIIDHKLSDIRSTNEAAFVHASKEGFDMMTVSPFPGNMRENYEVASKLDLGLIALVMMSNPEAIWMKESKKYIDWAKESEKYADGIVIGTTNHVTEDVMREIASLTTNIVLAPGIGKQGGSPKLLREVFGERVLFNVSRGITLADDIRGAAEEYYRLIIE